MSNKTKLWGVGFPDHNPPDSFSSRTGASAWLQRVREGKGQKSEARKEETPHLRGAGTQSPSSARGDQSVLPSPFSLPSAAPYQSFKVTAQSNQQRRRPRGRPRLPAPVGMECSRSRLPGQRDGLAWPRVSVGAQRRCLLCRPPGGSGSGLRNAEAANRCTGSTGTSPWPRREKPGTPGVAFFRPAGPRAQAEGLRAYHPLSSASAPGAAILPRGVTWGGGGSHPLGPRVAGRCRACACRAL